ncbi:MAG TPA: U32 family peptidase, partial [Candidatus Rifleibacterium sp.]|nr:U32 family peptidase [Candidatus Rifleibacterium sp.]
FGHGGAEELKDLGISRVILPREVSADELQKLLQTAPFELEIFVHGAMCYSISGRCFWSIALGTRSGNRGTCAQPCRREYSIDGSRGNGGSCLFSPRDLRLIDEVAWLKSSGVTSLKIEGRMKSPEYVYQVVKAYREALDDGKNRGPAKLNEVFTRAASSGFFNGPVDPAAWQTGDNPGREGVAIGVTTGKTSDGLVELQVKEMPAPGDGIVWEKNGEQQGARITWVKTDREHPKIVWVRGLPLTLGGGVELRRTSTSDEGSWESQWNRDWERRPVDLFWSGYEGTPLAVEAVINEHRLRLESEELLQLAMNKGLEEGPLQEKFAVLGDLFKSGRMITKLLGKGLHISGSALKKLKRSLVESLCRLEQLPPPKGEPSLAALILSSRQSRPDYSRHFAE